jgi:hypothetical protein
MNNLQTLLIYDLNSLTFNELIGIVLHNEIKEVKGQECGEWRLDFQN